MAGSPCTLCGRPTTMWCSRCQRAWYCSVSHLESDWPRHRVECLVQATPYDQLASPMETMHQPVSISALLFAPDHDRAQIVTVNCQPQPVRAAQLSVYPPTPLIQAYFPESRPQSVILTQGLNGDPLRFPLHLFYCPLSLSRGSPINHAVYRITSGAALKPWAGVVLVMKFNGTRRHGYADASTNDLPALSAYFLNYK